MAKGKDDTVMSPGPPPGKPVGLIDAIAEIQQYYVVERQGNQISAEFLTLKGKMMFMEIGFKAAFISGFISALMTPIALGVIEEYIPIFGSRNPSTFDKGFALILSISYSLGYALFLANLGKYYIGEITKTSVKNLLGGFVAGSLLKMAIVFLFFHFTYFVLLEPARLAKFLIRFSYVINETRLEAIYQWILNFKPIFLTSSYFVVFTTLLTIAIPIVSILIKSRKTRKLMALEASWQ